MQTKAKRKAICQNGGGFSCRIWCFRLFFRSNALQRYAVDCFVFGIIFKNILLKLICTVSLASSVLLELREPFNEDVKSRCVCVRVCTFFFAVAVAVAVALPFSLSSSFSVDCECLEVASFRWLIFVWWKKNAHDGIEEQCCCWCCYRRRFATHSTQQLQREREREKKPDNNIRCNQRH